MNISEIFDFVSFVANKYQAGGSMSPDEFNLACKVVSRELFNIKVGLPEEYQVGAPYARQAYQITQKITDDISHFIKDAPISKVNGYFALPSDYAAFSSISYRYIVNNPNCGGNPEYEDNYIEVVPDAEYRVRLADNVVMPTLKYPVATYRAQGILVKPQEISRITLTYLRYPVVPVYSYTVVNDEYVYDPINSVQCDFPDSLHPQFSEMVCRYLAINIREGELLQAIQERLNSGK